MEELKIPVISRLAEYEAPAAEAKIKKNLSNEETIVYNLLSCKPLSLDEIMASSKLSLQRVMGLLLGLEIKRAVKRLAGRQFIRSAD